MKRSEFLFDFHQSLFLRVQLKSLYVGHLYIDGLVQDCSNSIAKALELLQSCAKP